VRIADNALSAAVQAAPADLVLINPLPPAGIEPRPGRDNYWCRSALPDAHDRCDKIYFVHAVEPALNKSLDRNEIQNEFIRAGLRSRSC